jgi:hypothetical protein
MIRLRTLALMLSNTITTMAIAMTITLARV